MAWETVKKNINGGKSGKYDGLKSGDYIAILKSSKSSYFLVPPVVAKKLGQYVCILIDGPLIGFRPSDKDDANAYAVQYGGNSTYSETATGRVSCALLKKMPHLRTGDAFKVFYDNGIAAIDTRKVLRVDNL